MKELCALPLLFLDLDRFKSINDLFGHQEGDRALIEVAGVLLSTFRKSDVIGRIGGDEFGALMTDTSAEGASPASQRLLDKLEANNAVVRRPYQLGLSVGIAIYDPDRPRSLEELIKQADEAMYLQKSERRRTGS